MKRKITAVMTVIFMAVTFCSCGRTVQSPEREIVSLSLPAEEAGEYVSGVVSETGAASSDDTAASDETERPESLESSDAAELSGAGESSEIQGSSETAGSSEVSEPSETPESSAITDYSEVWISSEPLFSSAPREAAETDEPSRFREASIIQESSEDTTTYYPESTFTYVLNRNTKKFHYPSCPYSKKIKAKNFGEYTGSRDELIRRGYAPCKKCNP